MAKQTGDYKITGTYDDVTYYQMDGQYYARKKSSLTGKRVKRDPRFKRTMEWAHRLAQGSQLASKVYRSLPKEEQAYPLFRELKSLAIRSLKEGKSEKEVWVLLQQQLGQASAPIVPRAQKVVLVRIPPSFTKKLFSVRGGRTTRALGNKRRPCSVKVLRE